jgi:hypothetical protein
MKLKKVFVKSIEIGIVVDSVRRNPAIGRDPVEKRSPPALKLRRAVHDGASFCAAKYG